MDETKLKWLLVASGPNEGGDQWGSGWAVSELKSTVPELGLKCFSPIYNFCLEVSSFIKEGRNNNHQLPPGQYMYVLYWGFNILTALVYKYPSKVRRAQVIKLLEEIAGNAEPKPFTVPQRAARYLKELREGKRPFTITV